MLKKLNFWSIKTTARIQSILRSERGDTNFISILVILGIVVVLVSVFIGFKDQILGKVNEWMQAFEEW